MTEGELVSLDAEPFEPDAFTRGLFEDGHARLSSRAYTSRAIFALEMDRIFRRSWVYVAHESQLRQPGDYVTTRVGELPVIVTRDEDGAIHVLLNQCVHRGVPVCVERSGNANYFRCQYHGWTYRNDGELLGITFPRGYGEELPQLRAMGLYGVADVASYEGFIFCKVEHSSVTLEEHLGRAAQYLERFANSVPGYQVALSTTPYRYAYQANWKLQVENTVEAYHPSVTHSSFYDVMTRRTGGSRNPYARDDGPVRTRSLGNGHGLFELGKARSRYSNPEERGDSYFDRAVTAPDGERLVAELEQAVGRKEALRLIEPATDFNLAVFPNLMIVQAQVRVVYPVRHDYTEVAAFASQLEGAPPQANELRLRIVERFWGPCGFGSPDDLEIFERFQAAAFDCAAEWLIISRGEGREVPGPKGEVVGFGSDEGPIRSYYRRWAELLAQSAVPSGRVAAS